MCFDEPDGGSVWLESINAMGISVLVVKEAVGVDKLVPFSGDNFSFDDFSLISLRFPFIFVKSKMLP